MEQTEQPKVIDIPYISDDDLKKLTYINNLLLQELIQLVKEQVVEEVEDESIQQE